MTARLAAMSPPRRRQLFVLVGALAAVLVAGIAWWGVVVLRDDPVADQSRPGPVLLVPGYGGDVSDLDPLVAEVQALGREAVVFTPTAGGEGDLRTQARRLADLADRTLERTGAASVDLVGYSAGGVVSRLFVRDYGGAGIVRRVLTLGSPHHGTDVVDTIRDSAGGCPTACEQLAPDSELLARLNAGDETPAGPRWVTVRTSGDTIVTPVDSARLSGALNILVQDLCPDDTATHGRLPADPVVGATLTSALGVAAPHTPSDVTCSEDR